MPPKSNNGAAVATNAAPPAKRPAARPPLPVSSADQKAALADPLVQQVMNMFDGMVVNVSRQERATDAAVETEAADPEPETE